MIFIYRYVVVMGKECYQTLVHRQEAYDGYY